MQLHFKTYGSGEPLIILHGLLGSLDNWRSVSVGLAPHYRVISVDQRNHGHSPHSEDMNYTVMAQDVCELLDHEKLQRAHVLGHSMGGKTAMQLALLHPDRIAKLVVVDIAPHAYPPRNAKILSAMLALDTSTFQTRSQVQEALAGSIPELALRQFLLKNVKTNGTGGLEWRIGLREIFANYDRLREAIAHITPFRQACLFIRGEKSDYLLNTDLPSLRVPFPQARLETIPQAGHWVHIHNPEAFLETVLAFLENDGDFPLPA